jgi:prolyl oligopeptidase
MKQYVLLSLFVMVTHVMYAQNSTDPYQWLEEVDDTKSLEWVNNWNEKSVEVLTSQPSYTSIYNKSLEILNSTDRIADPGIYGEFIYNFWQDENHQRGVWRRTELKNYLSAEPRWEILLNLDELSEEDNVKWVFKGATGLFPDYNRFLVNLSKGGGDAVVIKEFDVNAKEFVSDGFLIPEAKGGASWIDENTLMVSTDFGEGVTTSGYPKQVKILKRGMQLNDAKEIFKGNDDDMGIWGHTHATAEKVYQLITRRTSFYEGEYYFIENGEKIKPIYLPILN